MKQYVIYLHANTFTRQINFSAKIQIYNLKFGVIFLLIFVVAVFAIIFWVFFTAEIKYEIQNNFLATR